MMNRLCIKATLALLVFLVAACASTQPYQNKKSVTSIAFSPDERVLAVADANEIRLMETGSRKTYRTLRELPPDPKDEDPRLFRHGVADSMIFLDNDRIATTGMGGLVTIWNTRDGRRLDLIESLPGNEFASTIDYSPATNRLAIGTSAGQILFSTLDNDVATPLVPMANLENYILDLQFSRDGRYIASASLNPETPRKQVSEEESADSFARKVNNPAYAGTLPSEPANDTAENDGSLATAGSNVVIWDVERLEKLGSLAGAEGVLKMGLVPEEPALITAGERVQIWEFVTQEQSEMIDDPSMVLQSIGLGALAVASLATLSVGAFPTGDFVATTFLNAGYPFIPSNLFIRHACARTAAVSPDGRTIVTTTRGPTLNVMSVIDRKENKVMEKWTADDAVCGLVFSRDGKRLVEANSRGLYVYDTSSWKKSKF